MSAPIVTINDTILCAHGAPVLKTAPASRVLIGGAPALFASAPAVVTGCLGTLNGGAGPTGSTHTIVMPMPCAIVNWTVGSLRVRSAGQPLLLQSSAGFAVPSGMPVAITTAQPRVKAI
jgi:hypothetical protein